MKKHWREYFAVLNRQCYQAVQIPEPRVDAFVETAIVGNTEAMYQAFKARLVEELNLSTGQSS